jgi:hypothetical protein
MTKKTWVKNWLILSFGIVFIIFIFNFIVDPFEYYRKATIYKVYYKNDERYRNPGLIKNYDYNSVLIGSSMTQNFLISDLNTIMNKTIKITARGLSPYEISIIFNKLFNDNKNIKKCLISIDISTYFNSIKSIYKGAEIPYYLYDNNIFNDYKYLINISTLKKSFNSLQKSFNFNKEDPLYKYEYMFQWEHIYKNSFGRKNVYKFYNENKLKKIRTKSYSFNDAKLSFDKNILSYIKKYPNIEFILFFPPYSIMEYLRWKENLELNKYLTFKEYLYNLSISNKNIFLYDFQVSQIVNDLDKYKDLTHYNQSINRWMIKQIKNKQYYINKNNILKYKELFLNNIETYNK